MSKIRWNDLPPALREHLFDRLRERKISAEDLYELKLWRESEPEAPKAGSITNLGGDRYGAQREPPRGHVASPQMAVPQSLRAPIVTPRSGR